MIETPEIKYCTSLKCAGNGSSYKAPKLVKPKQRDCPDCKSVLINKIKRESVSRRRERPTMTALF